MLVLPFTVTIRDAKIEIPASKEDVLDFLKAADVLYTVEDEDFESPLEIPFYPDEISIDYIEQDVDSVIPVTAEELNDMYDLLTNWTNQKALDAGLTYFGAEQLIEHRESDFTFYPANELDDLGSVLVSELCEVPCELIDYIDYESYASDYMMQVEGEVTEYGTIILKD